ncbi:MAG: protein kinase [Cyanobacteriota bacterium]|nr:protein kinase [Cyanobacteriota bacterium]
MTAVLINNRYRLISPLGKGGFGITVLAEDTHMPSRRSCVIKQLKPASDDPRFYQFAQERFHREAAILEELSRGNEQIPKLHAYFEETGRFYLVQELIEGKTLQSHIRSDGPMSESQVTEILASILSVLEYVHSKGIIHRDIKPDNVILRLADHKPVLIDFGAVKETMMDHDDHGQTKVIGTPGYMPIEQGLGRPVYSSDLYSLGLVAIFMLTGKHPKDLGHDPLTGGITWQKALPTISPTLATVINTAIQPHPRDRYSTAQEMLSGMGDLHVDMLTDQLRRFRRKDR